jgi:hypothetical protein
MMRRGAPGWTVFSPRQLQPDRPQVVISIDHVSGKSDLAWTIVGVVSDVKSSLDGPFRQTIYVPFTSAPPAA